MSQKESIVKTYSNQLKEVQSLLSSLGVQVTSLNKSEEKDSYAGGSYYHNEGVDSDHIKIYNLHGEKSFAFAFYYSEVETPYILASVKKTHRNKESQVSNAKYSMESFRQKLNEFVKMLKTLKSSEMLTHTTLEKIFETQFLAGQETNFSNEVDEAVEKIEIEVQKLQKTYDEKLETVKKLELKFKKNDKELDESVSAKREELKIDEIKESLKEAEQKLAVFKRMRDAELEVSKIRKEVRELKSEVNNHVYAVNLIIDKHSQNVPKSHRDKIRQVLSKRKMIKF